MYNLGPAQKLGWGLAAPTIDRSAIVQAREQLNKLFAEREPL